MFWIISPDRQFHWLFLCRFESQQSEIDDNNLDDFTKDILSSVGSLAAKANGCVKTDAGYVFDRGIDHKWDEVVEEVRNFTRALHIER